MLLTYFFTGLVLGTSLSMSPPDGTLQLGFLCTGASEALRTLWRILKMLHCLSLHLNIMSQSSQILSTDPFLSSAYGYTAGTLITRTLAKPTENCVVWILVTSVAMFNCDYNLIGFLIKTI